MARTGEKIQLDPNRWHEVTDFIKACPNCEVLMQYGDDGEMDLTIRVGNMVHFAVKGDWIYRTDDGLELDGKWDFFPRPYDWRIDE